MPRVYTRTDPATRFWAKVYKYRGCWLWEGSKVRGRYGQFSPAKGVNVRPARWAWEAVYGPIPAGVVLRRRCGSPACVRPEHHAPGPRQVGHSRPLMGVL
jgi:hypothetical protein